MIHPRATIGPNVEIGAGSYVAAGAIVTVNVRIGVFATINMHAQVAHDGVVEAFATLHPDAHVAGGVRIGEGAELGTGAAVIPGLTIGAWAVLGAGRWRWNRSRAVAPTSACRRGRSPQRPVAAPEPRPLGPVRFGALRARCSDWRARAGEGEIASQRVEGTLDSAALVRRWRTSGRELAPLASGAAPCDLRWQLRSNLAKN